MENRPRWTLPEYIRNKRQPSLWDFIRAAFSLSRAERRPFLIALIAVAFMAWTTPSSQSDGTLIDASWLNTYVVDNLLYLYSGLPSVRAYNTANESIPNNTATALTFNSDDWDTDTMHNEAGSSSELVATTAGKYLIYGHVEWAANNTGRRHLGIRHEGATYIAYDIRPTAAGSVVTRQSISTVWDMAAGESVELIAQQDSGGALNVVAQARWSPEFGMHRIG